MDGKSSLKKLPELRLGLPDEFAAFPVVLLDEVAVTGPLRGVTMCWSTTKGCVMKRKPGVVMDHAAGLQGQNSLGINLQGTSLLYSRYSSPYSSSSPFSSKKVRTP